MKQGALDLGHELVVDLFAGGGGASLGITWALGRGPDVAVNHDKHAIAMHRANHPDTEQAKCYERTGATNLARRLRTEMPGWAKHINAVPHPAYQTFPDKPEQAPCP